MAILTHAKFHFSRLMLTLIFVIRASEPLPGPGERLKRPGLMGLSAGTYLIHGRNGSKIPFRPSAESEI